MRSGMQVHRVEWKFSGEAQGHHHHPRYPEEQNVMSCPEPAARRVTSLEISNTWPWVTTLVPW